MIEHVSFPADIKRTPGGAPVGVPVRIWTESNWLTWTIYNQRGEMVKTWLTARDGTAFLKFKFGCDTGDDYAERRPAGVSYRDWHYPQWREQGYNI